LNTEAVVASAERLIPLQTNFGTAFPSATYASSGVERDHHDPIRFRPLAWADRPRHSLGFAGEA
jgi:hypothetical protein